MENGTLIGTGRLTWDREERISGRYGYVYLTAGGDSRTEAPMAPLDFPPELIGTRGRLVARVTETRESTHCGDRARGHYPQRPEVGEEITLGAGFLLAGRNSYGARQVGVAPAATPEVLTPGATLVRESGLMIIADSFPDEHSPLGGSVQFSTDAYAEPWMDPPSLYRAHEQTVELYFVPA